MLLLRPTPKEQRMIKSVVVKNIMWWERRATLLVIALLVMVAAMVVGYTTKAYAAPGNLDPSFDSDGKVTTNFANGSDIGTGFAIQEDGKMVVAGYAPTGSTGYDFAVARYNADGTLDTTFGTGGKVTTAVSPGTNDDQAWAVAVRPDGKIVVAGYTFAGTTTGYDFAVVRYNPNGTLDSTFSGDGMVITSVGTSTSQDQAYDVALQGNNVVVAGSANNDFAVVRYDANGNLDSTFGTGGVVKTDFFASADVAYALAVEPSSGKIVLAGSTNNPNNTAAGTDIALARYNSNGTLDTDFGSGGKAVTHFGFGLDTANDVAIQEDGKVVTAGYAYNGTTNDFALARYNSNGSLDGEFDFDGRLMTDFGGGSDAAYGGLALQDDGRILAAGASAGDFALARYNDDGSLNNSFSNDGKLKTDIASGYDTALGLAVQDDGKVVAAGYATTGSTTGYDFAVARYFGGHDDTPPNTRAPVQALLTPSTLGTSTTSASVPTRISWSATDADGEVTRYQLQVSTNAGAYTNVSLPGALTTTITPLLTPASNYRYRVRATDDNGNTSAFKYGPRFTVDAHQETSRAIAYSGTWTQQTLSGAYGGAVKYATVSGTTAKLTFTGRSVAWVASKSSASGQAEVYLDNVKVATVDLRSSSKLARQVVYAANGLNPSVTHTLQLKVLGTATRPRVDVDAFVVLR